MGDRADETKVALRARGFRINYRQTLGEKTSSGAMTITLRPVGESDERFLRELYATTREDLKVAGCPAAQLEALLTMQFRAQQSQYAGAYPKAKHDVILDESGPVGRLYVWRGRDELRLVDIALLPASRGRGVGTQLLRQLMAEAKAEGRALRLQVVRTNPARRLYERLGFRRTGGDGVYDEMEWSADARPAES